MMDFLVVLLLEFFFCVIVIAITGAVTMGIVWLGRWAERRGGIPFAVTTGVFCIALYATVGSRLLKGVWEWLH